MRSIYKIQKYFVALVLVATVVMILPQPQPAYAFEDPNATGGGGGSFDLSGEILKIAGGLGGLLSGSNAVAIGLGGVVQGIAKSFGVTARPLETFSGADAGIPNLTAVPTSVENPLQPGVAFNMKDFLLGVAKGFAAYALRKVVEPYVANYVNGVLNKYKIGNYLNYAINLADQVYVAANMKGASSVKRYITAKIVQDINNSPFGSVNLNPQFINLAQTAYNYNDISKQKTILDVYGFNSRAGNLRNLPAGQQVMAIDYASYVKAQANSAAALSIANGRGNKDSQVCPTLTNKVFNESFVQRSTGTSVPTAADFETVVSKNCSVKNPGGYAAQQIDSRLMGLLNMVLKPQDHIGESGSSTTDLKSSSFFGQDLTSTGSVSGSAADNTIPDLGDLVP